VVSFQKKKKNSRGSDACVVHVVLYHKEKH